MTTQSLHVGGAEKHFKYKCHVCSLVVEGVHVMEHKDQDECIAALGKELAEVREELRQLRRDMFQATNAS
jgi:hypothetical protein